MQNDLSSGICPAKEIVCCVIDEAHKALGNYAYTQVVRELVVNSVKFRVLALSATPGDDLTAIQEVSHVSVTTINQGYVATDISVLRELLNTCIQLYILLHY